VYPDLPAQTDIEAAAAALFCRFGDPTSEAHRRGRLKVMLDSSRALAKALEGFTSNAAGHFRGIHCTPDMKADVQRLSHALAEWTSYVNATADMYRECSATPVLRVRSVPDDAVIRAPEAKAELRA
jgi:hypothetical protein